MVYDNMEGHKKQGFTLSLENTFLENHRVGIKNVFSLNTAVDRNLFKHLRINI